MKRIIDDGSHMFLKHPPNEDQRQAENIAMLQLNNHKNAQKHPEILHKSIANDIEKGFSLVLPLECLPQIPEKRAPWKTQMVLQTLVRKLWGWKNA